MRELSPKERLRADIQALAKAGWFTWQISKFLGCSQRIVRRWRFRDFVSDASRSGRPLKLTEAMIKKITRQLQSKKKLSQRLVAKKVGVSQTTVFWAKKLGRLKLYLSPLKPTLTTAHKRNRRQFALSHAARDWSRVVFEDEKTFFVGTSGSYRSRGVYAYSREEVEMTPHQAHPPKLNVAAAIWKGGRSRLSIFQGTMDAGVFADIMEQDIMPDAIRHFGDQEFELAMDNDPKHRSATARARVAEVGGDQVSVMPWPSLSPDLNPIENVWAMLQAAVDRRPTSTLQQLRARLRVEWRNLSQEAIDHCIDSMPQRLQSVRAAKGGATKY